MKMKKVWALLLSLTLVMSMALPAALAVSDDQGLSDSAAATSSGETTPTVEEETTQEPEAEPEQDETQCTCGAAEGEAHEKGCPLYVKPEQPATQAEETLYQKFLATKTMEEANTLYKGLSKAEVTAFRTWLEENDKLTDLEKHLSAITPEGEPVTMPIVSFTKVGPLLAAPARKARMMRAAADQDDTGIVLNKSAVKTQDGYQITMEAYATGASSTTISTEPTDIVLVLDVSGSMDDPMTSYQYSEVYQLNRSPGQMYYIQQNGQYVAVTWSSWHGAWGYYRNGFQWNGFTPKTSASDTNQDHVQFYDQVTSRQQKMAALKTAVNGFIDSVAAKSPESQIALVKFAGDKSNRIGNDTYREGRYTYNYSQIVKNLTVASSSQTLKNAVNALSPAGATRADLGMEHAQSIINSVANDGRKKTVIMFTDGVPTSFSDFDSTVANSTIRASKTMKDAGATVYTIGVFEGANGTPVTSWNGVSNTNKYMHLVSSNYKNATSLDSTGASTYPTGGKSYYLSAGSADELNSIFQQISQEVGGSTSKLDENAVIRDIVTPYFNMPANTSDVKVYTAESDGSTAKWKEKVAFDGTVSVQNNTVSVSGFSYKDNWCGDHTENGVITFHNGKKLIIQFTITPKDGFLGGNDVLTNGAESGIYDKDGTLVKLFEQPTVNVPIQPVTVTAADKNVYLNGTVTAAELKDGATVKCGNVALKLGETYYGLEAWQNAYVDIEAGLKDKDGNALTGDYTNLTEDTTYTVSAKVAPKTVGESTTEKGPAATEQAGEDEGAIHVFKPELTFKDGSAYYGEDVVTDFSDNQVGETVWKHGNTLSTAVTMLGTKPTLDITLEADRVENGKYTKQDAAVKATVKIDGTDVTAHTTMLHQDCSGDCDWETPAKTGDPAFLIHVKTCTLDVTKVGGAAEESYVFDVYKDGEKYSEVTIWGNSTETLYELPVGTYTIKENTGWSWRFTPKYSAKVTLSAAKDEGEITCTNQLEKNKWLNGFSTVVRNIFGSDVATN